MRIIFAIIVASVLVGCAAIGDMSADIDDIGNPQSLHPQLGQDFDRVNKDAQDSHAGGVQEVGQRTVSDLLWSSSRIRYSEDYAPYKFYQTSHMLTAKQQRYVKNPEIYVFKQGKFVLAAREESLGKDMAPLIEHDKAAAFYGADYDLANEVHTEFGVWPKTEDVAKFHAYGINGASDFAVAGAEFKKYAKLYGDSDIIAYLRDRKVANDGHVSIEQAMQIRKAADAKEEAKIHAELLGKLKKMKFTVLFLCLENPACPACGWDWAFAKDLLGASMQHANYIYAKLLTEGQSAKYCTQANTPFRNLELLMSKGTSFGTDKDGVEYFLVKDSNSTAGVIGHRK